MSEEALSRRVQRSRMPEQLRNRSSIHPTVMCPSSGFLPVTFYPAYKTLDGVTFWPHFGELHEIHRGRVVGPLAFDCPVERNPKWKHCLSSLEPLWVS
jgi:hypothetical protein